MEVSESCRNAALDEKSKIKEMNRPMRNEDLGFHHYCNKDSIMLVSTHTEMRVR